MRNFTNFKIFNNKQTHLDLISGHFQKFKFEPKNRTFYSSVSQKISEINSNDSIQYQDQMIFLKDMMLNFPILVQKYKWDIKKNQNLEGIKFDDNGLIKIMFVYYFNKF